MNTIPLMQLTPQELEAHAAAAALPDHMRQHAFEILDLDVRSRFNISPRRYYFIDLTTGVVVIDMLRERVPLAHLKDL